MTKVEAPKQWGHLLRVDLAVGWWWWWWDFFFANNTGALHQTTFWKVPQCQQIPAKRHILIRNTHSQFDFVCWWACPVLPSKHVLLSKSFVLLKLRLQHDATFSLKYSLSPVVPFHFPSAIAVLHRPSILPLALPLLTRESAIFWWKYAKPPWFDPFTLCSSTITIENPPRKQISTANVMHVPAR